MAKGNRSTNWFIAGLCAFVTMFVYGFTWLINVFIDKVINGLFNGNAHVDLGILNKIAHYAGIITILVAAWCFVCSTLRRRTIWVILYLIFAVLVILGLFGIGNFSIF